MRRIRGAHPENEKVLAPYALSITITRSIIFSAGNQSRRARRRMAGCFKRHKLCCRRRRKRTHIHFLRVQPHNEIRPRWAYYSSPNHTHTRQMQNL